MSEKILEKIRTSPLQKIKVAVSDIDGILRGKYLHKDKFLSAVNSGFGFCNVVFGWDSSDILYDNVTYTGWHTGYPDALALLDLNTYRCQPWDNNIPFMLADFLAADGSPLPICPRQKLKSIIAHAEKLGYGVFSGFEFEWFNFRETAESLQEKHFMQPRPLTPGMFGYSLVRMAQNLPYFNAIMDELLAFGIPIEGLHTETGPGVYEAAINYSEALESADRAILFKSGIKEIATRFGIMPSFMAKWHQELPGCSGHIHLSLGKNGKNLFYDPKDPHNMSSLFKSFIAGVLHCLPDLLVFYAPTINSYKRLVDGYWAPTKANWGFDNRTVAARVIGGGEKSTRLELRITGSDINPYLALSAYIASGLYGIEKKMKLDSKPIQGSAYADTQTERLPRDLGEAITLAENSTLAKDLLGEEFMAHYLNTRRWEWRRIQNAVTSWERQRYFEII